MTKTSIKNLIACLKTLYSNCNKELGEYTIVFDNQELNDEIKEDETNKGLMFQVSDSVRFIMTCPMCDKKQTLTYSTLNKFLKNIKREISASYCINDECEYFAKGKRYGVFDVFLMFKQRGQTLLSKNYENIHDELHVQCDECGEKRHTTLNKFAHGRSCENPKCKLHFNKVNSDGNVIVKKDYTGEKNIRYDLMTKEIGCELLSQNPKDEHDECDYLCSEKHKFKSKMILVKNILKEKKKSKLCPICIKTDKYDKMIKDMQSFRVKDVSTSIDEYNKSTDIVIFECKGGHEHTTLSFGAIRSNARLNNGIFSCKYCTADEIKESKEIAIRDVIEQNGVEFVKFDGENVSFRCKCKNIITSDYRNIMRSRWSGLCKNCIHSNENVVSRMAHGNNGQKDNIMILPSGNKFIYQGYEDIIIQYLLFIGVKEENIERGKRFSYKTSEGKNSTYEPDLTIIENKKEINVIEVKSRHTYNLHHNKIHNLAPFVLNIYPEFTIYIIERNGRSIEKIIYKKIDNGINMTDKIMIDNPCVYEFFKTHRNERKNVNKEKKELEVDITECLHEFFDYEIQIPNNVMKIIRNNMKDDETYINKILSQIIDLTDDTPFPEKFVPEELAIADYSKLSNNVTKTDDNYIVSNTLGVTFLNYFTLDLILRAKNFGELNFHDRWESENFRYELWKNTLKERSGKVDMMTLIRKNSRSCPRIYNFPPNVARGIYNKFESKRVLDFCAGYGGRLVGFWQSNAKEYIGIDPNTEIEYHKIISWMKDNDSRDKIVSIISKPAEDVDFKKLGKFDTVFTSPPYFNLEIYSEDDNQSCNRYETYNLWKNKFLFCVLDKVIPQIEIGGYLAINIKNIFVKGKKYNILDDMASHLMKCKDLCFHSKIEMMQPKRSKSSQNEFIYVYTKIKKKIIEIVFEDSDEEE